MSLIHISPPTHLMPASLLDAPGGFVWWYADLIDAHGNGAVIIWSWGLPFLPGYADAHRRGQPQRPRTRPSVNVALYAHGKLDFYLLQELGPDQARFDGDFTWHFGRSRFESRLDAQQRCLNITLDMDVPGSDDPFQATLELRGVARREGQGEQPNDQHDWSPLTGPSSAHLNARCGNRTWQITGRGYHDRNGGHVPMHAQGIDRWLWGRLPFPDFERIYYLTWSHDGQVECHGLDVLNDGTTRHAPELTVQTSKNGRSYTGPVYPRHLTIKAHDQDWLRVDVEHVLDEGPFYLRFAVRGTAQASSATGIAELVLPDAIDQDLMRPLVRMRVHQTQGKNSMWLPLFTGPRQGRITRLLRGWAP